jgi:hypothetical protein
MPPDPGGFRFNRGSLGGIRVPNEGGKFVLQIHWVIVYAFAYFENGEVPQEMSHGHRQCQTATVSGVLRAAARALQRGPGRADTCLAVRGPADHSIAKEQDHGTSYGQEDRADIEVVDTVAEAQRNRQEAPDDRATDPEQYRKDDAAGATPGHQQLRDDASYEANYQPG